MIKRKETRLVLVAEDGKVFEEYNATIFEEVQDYGKTLKLFVRGQKSVKFDFERERIRKFH